MAVWWSLDGLRCFFSGCKIVAYVCTLAEHTPSVLRQTRPLAAIRLAVSNKKSLTSSTY
jgi:hypothetical protein